MMIRLVYLDIFECNYVKYTYGPAFLLSLFYYSFATKTIWHTIMTRNPSRQ